MNFWLLFGIGLTIGVHGYLGSGKTLMSVWLTYLYSRVLRHVYSDTPLNRAFFPDYTPLEFDYLVKIAITQEQLPYPRNVMLLDEFQYEADARTSSYDKWQMALTYFKNQSRKRKTVLIYTTEMRDYGELRYRENELAIKCYKWHLEPKQICYKDECYKPHFFRYIFLYRHLNEGRKKKIMHPELVYPMYQTEELGAINQAAPYRVKQLLEKVGMTDD